MRILCLIAFFFSTSVLAAGIDPAETNLPWKNGPTRDAVYKFSENTNKVHVLEALANYCSWCHKNAAQVEAMALEYAEDERVQFLDLSLDSSEREIARWLSQHSPSYPFVQDVNRNVYNAIKQQSGIPATFVLDCNGTLVGSTIGYWGPSEKSALRGYIAKAKEVTCN
jgi:hypothetical protein